MMANTLIAGRRGAARLASLACLLVLPAASLAAEWRITAISGAPVSGDPAIRFGTDGGITGTTGCNRFTTRGEMADGALMLPEPLAMTRMACPGEALTAQDDAIAAFLAGPIGIAFDPFSGEMTLIRDETVLSLLPAGEVAGFAPQRDVPAGSPPYLGVFGLSGELPIRAAPDTAAPTKGGVQAGTILRNDGCEDSGWCAVTTLSGDVSGWAEATYLEPAGPALRAGQEVFDATGTLPCAKGTGAPTSSCPFGVARGSGGDAAVIVQRQDGLRRALFFQDGRFASTDSSQAGGGFDTSATREGDLNLIRIDDERYEVPDAVVRGG